MILRIKRIDFQMRLITKLDLSAIRLTVGALIAEERGLITPLGTIDFDHLQFKNLPTYFVYINLLI